MIIKAMKSPTYEINSKSDSVLLIKYPSNKYRIRDNIVERINIEYEKLLLILIEL
jgi:hypothetical protein|tara:strand:- start:1794 stop:1958 length:165 start_codon:yes stop_codon:yes gene_type:complete